jgi:hypothetical protein
VQNENLVITTDDIYHPDIEIQTTSNVSNCFGDVDTGTAYLKTKKEYVTNLIFSSTNTY